MPPALSVQGSQADISAVGEATSDVQMSQADLMSIYNIPSDGVEVSQSDITFPSSSTSNAEVSQADVIVVVGGRVENPTVRAWTYSLDGHDFYVLRLGDSETLVYDLYSEQWMNWDSPGLTFWRPNYGINWIGGEAFGAVFGSNVAAGDDAFGLIWFLDPTQPYDQNPVSTAAQQFLYFQRVTTGQVALRGRKVLPCYAVWLTTDMGHPAYEGAGVSLLISDDAGASYNDMGLVTVTMDVINPEIAWYSLGQIEAPGRLFRLVDDGAITRIDGLEMNDDSSDDDG